MTVELNKSELIVLLNSIEPQSFMVDVLKPYGQNHKGKWYWNDPILQTLGESKLWYLYNICKDSWK